MWKLVLTRENGTSYQHIKAFSQDYQTFVAALQALFVLSKPLFRTALCSLLLVLLEPNK
jgi:hypothetical protein